MSVANIIDEITGKIDPKYLPVVPATVPTLNQVLTTGNQSGGILIDAQGGNINCDALKCLSIEALTAPLFNTIAVDADLIVTQFGKLGFEDNALITCNEANTAKNVIETTNASGNAIYKVAEGNIQYDTSSELLTVNGGMVLTSDLAKVEFKNGLGVLKGSIGYNVGTDFMDLTGEAGFEINTTAGPINITANGDKVNITTNGNNIELFGNTTGGFFADVNIGTADGVIQLGAGGHVEFLSPTEVITKSLSVIETATPTLRFQTTGVGPTSTDVVYNPTGSIFGEPSLIATANEIGTSTGIVEGVSMGFNSALQTAYVSGKGLPLFIGESGANSYSGIILGNANAPTNALFIDRKDDTDVTQSAATMVLTGTGQINIESTLATGGIGISTVAVAPIVIASGQSVGITAATDITLTATNAVNITSGFTDVTLTASLGQIYQLGGQRVRTRFVSSAFYNPVVSDYAICMENAGGSTLTLPLITAANVGKQYLILHNSTAGAVSVQTALGSGQTIFSSTGAASQNPRSLPIGHCHTFTAMQVSAFPSIVYGWAMI